MRGLPTLQALISSQDAIITEQKKRRPPLYTDSTDESVRRSVAMLNAQRRSLITG